VRESRPKTFVPTRTPRLALVLGFIVLAVGVMQLRMLFDDSFITYRYAMNFARGDGLVFNPGERVEGYTCFLWVLILGAVMAAGGNVVLWAQVLGLAASTGSLVVAQRLTSRLAAGPPLWPQALAPLLLATNPAFVLWTGSGMETALFTFLVTLTVAAYLRQPGAPSSGIALALATMTRPDGALWGVAFLVDQLRRGRRARWGWLVTAATIFGPYLAWRISYYGDLLPNTFYAKVGGGTAALGLGLTYVATFLGPGMGLLLVVPAAVGAWIDREHRLLWGTIHGLVLAYVIYVGGDIFPLHRFLMPILPVVAALAACGARHIWVRLGSRRAGIVFAAFALVAAPLWVREHALAERVAVMSSRLCVVAKAVAEYLAGKTRPDDSIAAMGVGALAFYSDRTVIDMLGLTNAHIAHRTVPMGTGLRGHEKYDAGYVLGRRPAFILLPSREALAAFVTESSGAKFARSFPGLPALEDMESNPRFRTDYVPDELGSFRRRDHVPAGSARPTASNPPAEPPR
jgi:arabinofuranosyltransferase